MFDILLMPTHKSSALNINNAKDFNNADTTQMPITTYAHPRRGSGDAKVKQHYTIPKLFISFVSLVSISISCP